MTFSRPVALTTLSLLIGLPSAGGQSMHSSESDPMRVMSDTPEYCWHLASEFYTAQRRAHDLPPDVRVLAHEGQSMCDHGLIRGGIRRLRRALLLLQADQ
jgi:hypothetical protein